MPIATLWRESRWGWWPCDFGAGLFLPMKSAGMGKFPVASIDEHRQADLAGAAEVYEHRWLL